MTVIGYVIIGTSDKNPSVNQYYAINQSGGYPFWAGSVESAKRFPNLDEPKKILQSAEFTKSVRRSDGADYPPTMVRTGAELNIVSQSKKGSLTCKICPVVIGDAEVQQTFFAEIPRFLPR